MTSSSTSSRGRGLLHLAAAVDLPGVHDIGPHVELARLAERGGLDFVTLDDSLARPGPDASAVLAQVAPATHRVGLVPTLTTTHTEPFDVQATTATLDRVSRGRAGWRIDVSTTQAGEVADAVAKSWGSWEDDAETGEVPNPVRVVDATEGHARSTAARHADVALVRATSSAQARAVRDQLRSDAAGFGRDPDSLRILASLLIDLGDGEHAAEPGHGGGGPRPTARGPLYRGGPVDLADLIASWHQDGTVDGFHLTPVEPRRDLERLVNGTVGLLQHRGLFRTFYPGSTLREHLGLTRPVHQYVGGAP
ncbi:LLM class flavin-dependent oxidoreductase [Streptomyces sp. NY05-11A]|uniref:LLM class flavin-dependent oxidoreductase n=1 Tax=Streptomyces soliscabiei TaxID=588897 RepID=UPI0029B10C93|nr:LLM class flavin-dependent oxidoreductase [Streptomyces sp. NY05-11A]MDX2676338.1 LLM class flavin-dependent oxidoreductase [Streptomyces sp. NY05-11A]